MVRIPTTPFSNKNTLLTSLSENSTGQPDFPATRGNQDCQRFMTVSDNIGINWGDWPLDMAGLYVYKDAECKEYASQMIAAPEWDDAVGMNTCISQRQNGGPWQSIRFSGDGQ